MVIPSRTIFEKSKIKRPDYMYKCTIPTDRCINVNRAKIAHMLRQTCFAWTWTINNNVHIHHVKPVSSLRKPVCKHINLAVVCAQDMVDTISHIHFAKKLEVSVRGLKDQGQCLFKATWLRQTTIMWHFITLEMRIYKIKSCGKAKN